MARMPGAAWKPLGANWADQPRMRAFDIVAIHTMVGGLEGTDNLFRVVNGPGFVGVESHFGTAADGRIVQWQDTTHQAEANYNGNHHIISIENADWGAPFPSWSGSNVPAFTPQQIEANAQICAWAHRTHGIPLELIPDSKPGRRGIAPHRLGVPGYVVAGGELWSTAQGKACPGDRRIAQIPQIIARAKQIVSGAPLKEDFMASVQELMDWPFIGLENGRTVSYGEAVKAIDANVGQVLQQVAGLNAAVTALANAVASGRDDLTAADLEAAVKKAIFDAGEALRVVQAGRESAT